MDPCPACGATIESGAEECPSCGLMLSGKFGVAGHVEFGDDELVTVATCRTTLDTEILIGRLRAEGVPAVQFVAPTIYGSVLASPSIGTRVVVHRRDAALALRILAREGQWSDEELARFLSMLEEAPPGPP